jgi:hypothetical protein
VGLERIVGVRYGSWGRGMNHGGIEWIVGTWNGLWRGETDGGGVERIVRARNGSWGCGMDRGGVKRVVGTWNGSWGG